MKRIGKLIISAAAAICIAVPFSACERTLDLESPAGFNLDEKYTLTWEPVANARSYLLEIKNVQTGKSSESTSRRETYLLSYLETGDYDIRVRAIGDGKRYNDSEWSTVLSFNRALETGCSYRLINNGLEYEIASAYSTLTEIVMEDSYRGKPVTSVGTNAFSKLNALESIKIGKNVKRIGEAAFYNCVALKDVDMPDTVTEIGPSAFQACRSLESFTMPSGVTSISDSAFSYCRALKEFDFNNVTEIGESSFAGCGSFTHLVIPDAITSIGPSAFAAANYDNTGIKEVTIGSGVTVIGKSAFSQCNYLEKVNFSDRKNLKKIDKYVFAADPKLASITLPDGLEEIGVQAFYNTAALESVDIPDSVHIIGSDCFYQSKIYKDAVEAGEHLVYVDKWLVSRVVQKDEEYVIKQLYPSNPDGLEDTEVFREDTVGIADYVFWYNDDIEDVKLPSSMKYLGASAFSVCENMFRFDASESMLEVVDIGALAYCKGLLSVYLNDNKHLKEIAYMAFYGCENLSYNSSLGGKLIPDSVESIGSLAFEKTRMYDDADEYGVIYADDWVIGCQGRYESKANVFGDGYVWVKPGGNAVVSQNIELKEGTRGIADYAFTFCFDLTTISRTAQVEVIGRGAFYGCQQLMGVNLNTNIRKIDDYTFYECRNLTFTNERDYFPTALREIGRAAFYNCTSMATIDLASPSRLESVGPFAFYGCRNATELEIGSRLTEISEYTFYGCASLKTVTIPSNIKRVGNSAFSGCTGLTEVVFEEGVEEIGAYAFNRNLTLPRLSLPDSVKTIETAAFMNCSRLNEIDLNQVEYIGDYAFAGNVSLINIVIPESVKHIGAGAFYRLGVFALEDNLPLNGSRSVIIREGLDSLDAHAFYGCQATFYMEDKNMRDEWGSSWNSSRRPVVWGVTLDESGAYVVSLTVQKNTFEYYDLLNSPSGPYRAGYTFVGWSLSPASNEIAYTVQTVMNAPVGTTLYAVYMQA